ncbi:MAG TPA: hypothetical protein VKE74_23055, partial [Gemmataceae bacterium]|nr:hypothetical protein [Gemmataceae bacterium]
AGEPILDYFPRAVTEAEWQAAQAALRSREKRGGRPTTQGDRVNVFQRLLYDARSGDRLHIFGKGKRLLLGPVGARHRGDSGTSFPLPAFERGILSALAELDPRELFDKDEGPDEVAELSARIARIDTQLRALVNMFDEDEVIPEVADKVRAKNAERAKLVELLDQARARAASPRSAAWGTCQGIIEELDKAGDQRELRVRLRQVLARIISVVHCMFGGSGMTRVAAAQVRFHDSEQVRNYLIVHRGSRWAKRPGEPPQTETLSFKAAGLRGELDLRDPKDAAALGRELSRWAKARV